VENGTVLANAIEEARLVPKIETSEPGATACPEAKLAEFSAARVGSICGVWEYAATAPKTKSAIDNKNR
jgi:purine nucleoside phosphorylase